MAIQGSCNALVMLTEQYIIAVTPDYIDMYSVQKLKSKKFNCCYYDEVFHQTGKQLISLFFATM